MREDALGGRVNATPLAGTRLTEALAGVFPETGDVLEDSGAARDSFGHVTADWDVVTGLSGLACAVGSESVSIAQLVRSGLAQTEVVSLAFVLASHHPEITTANRWRWNGEDWRITAVFPDPAGSFTHLTCERVTPGV